MPAPGRVALARLHAAHGIQGRVRAELIAADPGILFATAELRASRRGVDRALRVERIVLDVAASTGDLVVLAFEGVRRRREAQALRGCILSAPSQEPSPPAPRSLSSAAGAEVYLEDGPRIGTVVAATASAEGCRLVLRTDDGAPERSLRLAGGTVKSLDLRTRRLVLRRPAGEGGADAD